MRWFCLCQLMISASTFGITRGGNGRCTCKTDTFLVGFSRNYEAPDGAWPCLEMLTQARSKQMKLYLLILFIFKTILTTHNERNSYYFWLSKLPVHSKDHASLFQCYHGRKPKCNLVVSNWKHSSLMGLRWNYNQTTGYCRNQSSVTDDERHMHLYVQSVSSSSVC
jgi:hypothetical protein